MSEVKNEETVGPSLLADESNAEPTEIRTWIQDLGGIDTPRHRRVRDVNHAILLSESLVNIVNVAKCWVPTCIELLLRVSTSE